MFFIVTNERESGHYGLLLLCRYHTVGFKGTTSTCLDWDSKDLHWTLKDCSVSDGKRDKW